MFFAVIAIGLLGIASLATEVGTWYLARSAQDNAADAAAVAAALAVSVGSSYSSAATDTATDNGFTSGGNVTVTSNNPPATGNYATNPAAAEVLINVNPAPLLSSVFTSTPPTVASRSVAIVEPVGTACVLSTIGDLQITSNQTAQGCMYASNASDATAVNVPSAQITAYGVTSVGTCTGCGNGSNNLLRPAADYQPPTINPYTSPYGTVDSMSLPTSFTAVSVPSPVPANYTLVPATANGAFNTGSSVAATYTWTAGQPFYAYESNLVIPAGTTVTLVPGTYFFVNASLALNGGTIQCKLTVAGTSNCAPGADGVTIVLMGNPSTSVGTLTIGSSATVILGALKSQTSSFTNSSGLGSAYTALNGMLFYRRGHAFGENVGAPGVNIYGKSSSPYTILNGGMYFPNSYVSYGANGGPSGNTATCSIIVAGYLSLTNTASQFTTGNCTSVYATALPQVQAVRVVE